jgi:hypothetical protein
VRRSAREAGHKTLYHYDQFRAEYLGNLLRKRRFHCAGLANLNDPWDCRPWFKPDPLADPNTALEFVRWMVGHVPSKPMSVQQEAATVRKLVSDPDYRKGLMDMFSRDFLGMIPGRWRIYCLTPCASSILMWSHYADDHRGICLEYSTDDPMFASAREVSYFKSYPDSTPQLLETQTTDPSRSVSEPHGLDLLLMKSDVWSYENEFRIIGLAGDSERPVKEHPLLIKDGFLDIGEGALKAIIIGCEANYEEIVNLIRTCDPTIAIKRAVRSPTEFRLVVE